MTACGVNNQGAGTRDGYGTTQYDNQTRTGMMGNRNAPDNTFGNNMNGNGLNNGMNNGMNNRGNNLGTNNDYSRELSKVIANSCTRIGGIDKATAVVYGNDIVIGVQTDNNNNNNNNNNNVRNRDLERTVRQNIQQLVPTMNVHVTSDRNMMTRINNMDRQMRDGNGNGMGLRNIGNDFATLIRDIGRTVTAPFR